MKIVITGASKGIGLELTRQALIQGYKVYAVSRNADGSKELLDLNSKYDPQLILLNVDVSSPMAPQKIATTVGEELDILINNAGILLEGQKTEDFLESFKINSIAPFLII
jgi:NAD(P)-dependent dehydrogenase (short-subunit alcohol dehydrogenase family)